MATCRGNCLHSSILGINVLKRRITGGVEHPYCPATGVKVPSYVAQIFIS